MRYSHLATWSSQGNLYIPKEPSDGVQAPPNFDLCSLNCHIKKPPTLGDAREQTCAKKIRNQRLHYVTRYDLQWWGIHLGHSESLAICRPVRRLHQVRPFHRASGKWRGGRWPLESTHVFDGTKWWQKHPKRISGIFVDLAFNLDITWITFLVVFVRNPPKISQSIPISDWMIGLGWEKPWEKNLTLVKRQHEYIHVLDS